MATDDARAGTTRPSISDVARLAGVAIGTVSNVLNNPDKVTDDTRRRVSSAIAQLGYIRNDAARSLAAGSSTSVGLVVADLGNSLFIDIARGAENVLRRRGYNVLIANSGVDPDREVRNLEVFEEARVAGILFAPLDTVLARSPVLPVRSTPTILVNFASPALSYSGVVVDERHGGSLAAEHLLALGRRRLLFVGGPTHLTAVRERFEGAKTAVDATEGASLEILETTGLNLRHGRRAAEQVLACGAGSFDGIVGASDLIAIGLAQTFAELPGFRVPADVAITGYDDNHFASESSMPITTISQHGEEMGRVAAGLLLEKMAGTLGTENRTVVLEPELIRRRSTLGETAKQTVEGSAEHRAPHTATQESR